MEQPVGKLSEAETEALSQNLVDDMVAFFQEAQASVIDLIDQADKNGWTPEQLEYQISRIIG